MGAASCVTQPIGFLAAEATPRRQMRSYRLRRDHREVFIRHPLLDMWVLEEIFRFQAYRPPESARAALRTLGRPVRVLDLGGHVGLFGLYALSQFPVESIRSYEPDPSNVAVLRRCVTRNGLAGVWTVIEAAAGTAEGHAEFSSSAHLSRVASPTDRSLERFQDALRAHFTFLNDNPMLTDVRHQVRQADVLPTLSEADLVKIDIEGAEWAILDDPRFAAITARAVVLEYHPAYSPHGEPLVQVVGKLRDAGFTVDRPTIGPDAGTIWAWRPDQAAATTNSEFPASKSVAAG